MSIQSNEIRLEEQTNKIKSKHFVEFLVIISNLVSFSLGVEVESDFQISKYCQIWIRLENIIRYIQSFSITNITKSLVVGCQVMLWNTMEVIIFMSFKNYKKALYVHEQYTLFFIRNTFIRNSRLKMVQKIRNC